MRFDQGAVMEGERRAYNALTSPLIKETYNENGMIKTRTIENPHYVPPKLTTSPAMLIQELAWVNTTTTFLFDFSINGPAQTPGVNNNIVLKKNDVFAFYGMQILLATGTNAASFIYRAHGVLPADDSAYNSVLSIKTESSTYIDKMEGQYFRDNAANANEYYGDMGLQIINPVRIISGEMGVFQVVLTLKNPSSALVFSTNTLLSMRLHGVYGQARG
jgi:hypothetical protein